MEKSPFACFAKGLLFTENNSRALADCPWKPHPRFAGVEMKQLVEAEETQGLLTCFLVRIAPGKTIGMHAHPDSIELHEVIAGNGVCLLRERELSYGPGSLAILPAQSPHEVRAGSQGLHLFAKFLICPEDRSRPA